MPCSSRRLRWRPTDGRDLLAARLLGLLRDSYGDDSPYSLTELIDRLCSVDLLHIDDVGAEQSSAWVLEQLYTIVNTRYEDGEGAAPDHEPRPRGAHCKQIGARTVSRIFEICGDPLPMWGDDKRRERAFVMPAPPSADEDAFWEGGTRPRTGAALARLTPQWPES